MKKEILSAVGAALVALLLLLLILLPHNSTPPETTAPQLSSGNTTIKPATRPPVPPTTSIVVTPTGTTIITAPTTQPAQPTQPTQPTQPPVPGVVRLYTCDAALHKTYVELAAEYYAQTGVEVQVLAPAEGDCQQTLLSLLDSDQAPTLFCIHSQETLDALQHRLQDLTGTQAAAALYGDAFALTACGKTLALAADVSGSGIIYNADLLASPVGFTQTDFHSFSDLQYIVRYITANRGQLGTNAFTAPDFSDFQLMEYLAGMYPDAAQLRAFVDLYFGNTTSKTTTLQYFLKGTTVFYIGGTEDYDAVSPIGSNNLGFLPAYSEGTDAVHCYTDHYWAVSGTAYEGDIAETVAFLNWLVSEDGGVVPVDRLGLLAPYRNAAYAENKLEEKLREYIATGNAHVSWTVRGTVTDMEAFTAALQAYKAAATDENWAAVAACFASST